LDWALNYNVFLKISAVMYVIFAVGLFALGAQYHRGGDQRRSGPDNFGGYFTMLAVQLIPLTVTGFRAA